MASSPQKNQKSCLTTGLRLLAWGVTGIVILLICLAVWQAWSGFQEARRYPRLGQLYEVKGILMHLNCTGTGSPTILMESGLGGPASMWGLVQPKLEKNYRVCSYDRSGLGWSEASTAPRTVANIVNELHVLLQEAHEAGPYLLVGHSFGGYVVRMYAKTYPEEVLGIALVGAGHEDFARRIPSGCEAIAQSNISFGQIAQPLSMIGIVRLAGALGMVNSLLGDMLEGVPADLQSELLSQTLYKPTYWKTYVAEMSSLPESEDEMRATGSLGSLPLVVISGNPDVNRVASTCDARNVVSLSQELQRELTNLSNNNEHITCDTCGHYIPLTDPQLVVDAVEKLQAKVNR